MYHDIGLSPKPPSTVGVQELEVLVASLFRFGWTSLTLGSIVKKTLQDPEWIRNPGRVVCFTFDDGASGILRHALPIFRNYGFVGTVFVVPKWVGTTRYYSRRRCPAGPVTPEEATAADEQYCYASWQDLQTLVEAGFEIGSHSTSHYHLGEIDDLDLLLAEIGESRQLIENKLGIKVTTFAYPYGQYNAATVREVRRWFKAAVTVKPGIFSAGSSLFEIPRIPGRGLWQLVRTYNKLLKVADWQ